MATRNIKVQGTANWAKVFSDNRDMKGFEGAYTEHDGAYTINVVLQAEEFDTLKKAGSKKKGTSTPEGMDIKFTRKHKDRFEWAGGPPKVTDADDNEWDFERDGVIPNGSLVEVSLAVYDTSRSAIVGTRLEAVKVLKKAEMEGRGTPTPTPKVSTPSYDLEEVPF